MKVDDVALLDSELFGQGGFACLQRCQLQNRYEDGSASPPYRADMLVRDMGADAVVVLPYERQGEDILVLLRRGLRPALRFGRAGDPPREGGVPPLFLLEAVAGILERGDAGLEGVKERAAIELHEEAGLVVDASVMRFLGGSAFALPGLCAERMFFCTVETPLSDRQQPAGDGSLLEHGATVTLLELTDALARCDCGEIVDMKTELALRRLKAELGR